MYKVSAFINILLIGIIISLLFFYNPIQKENFKDTHTTINKLYKLPSKNSLKKSYHLKNIFDSKWYYINKNGFKNNTYIPYTSYYKNGLWGFYHPKKNSHIIDLGHTLKAYNKIHALVLLKVPTKIIINLAFNGNVYYNGKTESIISYIHKIYKYSSLSHQKILYNEIQNVLNDLYYYPANDSQIKDSLYRDILNTSDIWDKILIQYAKNQNYNSIQLTSQRYEDFFTHDIILL